MSDEYRRGRKHGWIQVALLAGAAVAVVSHGASKIAGTVKEKEEVIRLLEGTGAELAKKLTKEQARAAAAEIEASSLRSDLEGKIEVIAQWEAQKKNTPAVVTSKDKPNKETATTGVAPKTVYTFGHCKIKEPTVSWYCRGKEILVGGRVAFQLEGRGEADFLVPIDQDTSTAVNLSSKPCCDENGENCSDWCPGETLQASVDDTTPPPPAPLWRWRWWAGGAKVGSGFGPIASISVERRRWAAQATAGAVFSIDGLSLVDLDTYAPRTRTEPLLAFQVSRKGSK